MAPFICKSYASQRPPSLLQFLTGRTLVHLCLCTPFLALQPQPSVAPHAWLAFHLFLRTLKCTLCNSRETLPENTAAQGLAAKDGRVGAPVDAGQALEGIGEPVLGAWRVSPTPTSLIITHHHSVAQACCSQRCRGRGTARPASRDEPIADASAPSCACGIMRMLDKMRWPRCRRPPHSQNPSTYYILHSICNPSTATLSADLDGCHLERVLGVEGSVVLAEYFGQRMSKARAKNKGRHLGS